MKVCGIVAEYNPFHNGHQFHIDETKRLGATHVVAVMSGNFVQRSEPAIISKFERARLAVLGGIDLVVELPVQYATGSSERFATGAIQILNSLGCVDEVSFGSECGDIDRLNEAVAAVADKDVLDLTRQLYETGVSYPAAREMVVERLYGKEVSALLRTSNNILGIEYIKVLNKLKSNMKPITFRREGSSHDGEDTDGYFASAKLLREEVRKGVDIINYVPFQTRLSLETACSQGHLSGGIEALSQAILFSLRTMTKEDMNALPDCADGLGNRLYNATSKFSDVFEIMNEAKTKRYTMSRVRRAVLSSLIGMDESYYFDPPYIRILALGRNGEELLNKIGKTKKLPMSHSLKELSKQGENALRTAKLEAHATDIYNLSLPRPALRGRDYSMPLFKED